MKGITIGAMVENMQLAMALGVRAEKLGLRLAVWRQAGVTYWDVYRGTDYMTRKETVGDLNNYLAGYKAGKEAQ